MRFITDMGESLEFKLEGGDPIWKLGRYGVWDSGGRKPEVIETGDDLDQLQAKYGPGLEVKLLPRKK